MAELPACASCGYWLYDLQQAVRLYKLVLLIQLMGIQVTGMSLIDCFTVLGLLVVYPVQPSPAQPCTDNNS